MCQPLNSEAYPSAVSTLQPFLTKSATKPCRKRLSVMKASASSFTLGRKKLTRATVAVYRSQWLSVVLIFGFEPSTYTRVFALRISSSTTACCRLCQDGLIGSSSSPNSSMLNSARSDSDSSPRDSEAITCCTDPRGPLVAAAIVSPDQLFLFTSAISTIIRFSCSSVTLPSLSWTH